MKPHGGGITDGLAAPVFTDPTPDTPSIIQRFRMPGGFIQVAVMMPQGMEIEDMTVVVSGKEDIAIRSGEAVIERTRVVVSACVFEEVDSRG